ncbi:MAG: PadR family transcriptional regulator [Gemmatimonadaceae bacterium]
MARDPATPRNDLLKGTLDMLVLQTLAVQKMHGYAIAQRIEELSSGAISAEAGSLYPALERVQKKGWAISEWGVSSTGRRVRYYTITKSGRKQLGIEISDFDAMFLAINKVLGRG